MEVHLTPEQERQLADLAAKSGRATDTLAQEAIAGYLSELADVRGMLDSRYDDIKNGKIKLIPGEEVFTRLREKSQARSRNQGS